MAKRRTPAGTRLPRRERPAGAVPKDMAAAVGPPPAGAPEPGAVIIRSAEGEICRVRLGPRLQQAAMEWVYVLRHRRRWTASRSGADAQVARARQLLASLGVDDEAIRKIALARLIEVSVTFRAEREGWEARILPWEHVLSAATRTLRAGAGLTVVRNLLDPARAPIGVQAPRTALYVESAPCGLREDYAFDAEERLVHLALAGQGPPSASAVHTLRDPTRHELQAQITALQPDLVHLAGFDAHQATRLLAEPRGGSDGAPSPEDEPTQPPDVLDGYLLRRDDGRPDLVNAEDLAALLTSGGARPSLVAFNVYNSAARLAALVVARGAAAAIGYQDDFSDRLGEVLYDRLYWAWCQDGEDVLSAFQYAWSEVRQRGENLGGSGVVLWGAASWVQGPRAAEPLSRLTKLETEDRNRILPLPPEGQAQEQITADVKPYSALNYSILHNSKEQSVFEHFVIAKPRGRVHDLNVRVSLYLGSDTTVFELTSTVADPVWSDTVVDLARTISVALVSPLLRSLRDSTKTLITVRVAWGPHVVYHRTHPVTLLAIDEWRDDDANRIWLPSFVLPGDPAVRRVVDAAQRYLIALADDPATGFDGYQSGHPETVDLQAQAIWSAIVQDYRLSYINPPPGGAESSQRVRTPSDVIGAGHGTCIDLALLYTACLEYINVNPVMVLLAGHAFPAYWRSESAQQAFAALTPADVLSGVPRRAAPGDRPSTDGASGRRTCQWAAEKWVYPWLRQQVRAGALVPIETVFLTSRMGFDEAVEEGAANLSDPREFDSIQDVLTARAFEVTPLPLHDGGRP